MQPAAPETLSEGRFQLLQVIGEGGMATVYRAFDQRLQRPRAIKVLSPALAQRPSLRKRFLSEAQTMANLEESRVVRIFDMGEDGDRVFIVMELVEGGSLLDRVRDYGPLPPRMAAEATIQICESLQAAHDAGVIHRDIKPHNILLTRSGEIRVTDFGIAQVQSEDGDGMTRTGAVMGTWGFMAPEQKSNAKLVDARADVYSVGATLWALLKNETPPELFMADAESHMLDGIPEELAEVIKRATRYRREERYGSARDMAVSLRAFLPMLPEDPELSVPLAAPLLERQKPMDTMQQFASEVLTPSAGTMVPTLAGEVDAPPSAPSAPEIVPLVKPAAPTFVSEPAAKPKASRAGIFAFLILVPGILLLGAVLVGAFLFWPDQPTPKAPPTPTVTKPVEPTPAAPSEPAPPPVVPENPPVNTKVSAPSTPSKPVERPVATPVAPTPTVAPPPVPTPVAPASDPVVADATPVAAAAVELTHTPPADAKVGDTITFSAAIPGNWTVKLYWKPASGGAFTDKTMSGSGTYTTSLKATDTMVGGIAYFIEASKDGKKMRVGSPTSPKKVGVAP